MVVKPPPVLSSLPAGAKLRAGLGFSTVLADLDFESYSEAGYVWNGVKWESLPGLDATKRGLKTVGAAVYSEHRSTEVLSLWYDLKDGNGARFWKPGLPLPSDLLSYTGLIEAHNSSFEYWIWRNVCAVKYGWPLPDPSRFRCSMGKARAHSLPGSLGEIGKVLKLDIQKDKDGDRLIKKFCMPRQPSAKDARTRVLPGDDPDFAKLVAYNLRDIEAEAEASSRIPDLREDELAFWHADQAINIRGVAMDARGIDSCIVVINAAFEKYNSELRELTSGKVNAASEVAKLAAWAGVPSMDADSVEEYLSRPDDFTPAVYRAFQIRSIIGSAAVKKLFAMRARLTKDDRMHDLFGFHAARTGRSNGNGPQPTNLPNSGPEVVRCECGKHYGTHRSHCPWCGHAGARKVVEWNSEAASDALEVISHQSLELVEYTYGNAVAVVSGCLRGLFTAAPGHDLISSDYSAIEAVVLAALAGEEWRMDVFRTHGKIYEMSASKISGVPFEEIMEYAKREGKHHPLRKTVGKVAELASGFGGWINAWKAFGADEFMSDDEIKRAILAWREASPAIVEFWGGQYRGLPWKNPVMEMYGVEGMAISAVLNPGVTFTVRNISYTTRGGILYCILPSGRAIAYHAPVLRAVEKFGVTTWALSYEGWNSNPKNGGMGWVRMDTYSGRLVENIVQAVACDILRYAIVNLESAGYPVVMHVYDEVVCEVREGNIRELEQILGTLPEWAKGWPISAAGGWKGKRYRK